MSSAIRVLVFIAAASVIAAATHANVIHAGGYGSRDAPLIITLAVLLALGMAFAGVCFNEARRWQAVLLAILILPAEAYWRLVDPIVKRRAGTPHQHRRRVARGPRRGADTRREKRRRRSRTWDAAASPSKPLKKDRRIQLRQAAVERVSRRPLAELDAARDSLAGLPEPRSTTPLSDLLGIAPWAWSLQRLADP